MQGRDGLVVPLLVVSQKGSSPFKTIGDTIREALPNSRIVVKEGLYKEGLILDKPVEIVGDGSVGGIVVVSRNSPCVLMQTKKAKISGLTLRCLAGKRRGRYCAVEVPEGDLALESCDITCDSLGCIGASSPSAGLLVRGCRVHDGMQGGILIDNQARARIELCDIVKNRGIGVGVQGQAQAVISDCRVRDGAGYGILYSQGAQGMVEGCDISGNAVAGIGIKLGAFPMVRRCKIHDHWGSGVWVSEGGLGTIEECEISKNESAGVEISEEGNPRIRKCGIHDGKTTGVLVHQNGLGSILESRIFGNANIGVAVARGGNPVLRGCKITRNYRGVWVYKQGGGTFEDCEVSESPGGEWHVEAGCKVKRKRG